MTNYDANGHPLSFIDPDGVATMLNYSPRGWLHSKTVGNAVTRYRHDAAGQLTQVMNPDGSTVAYVHDAAHRLTDIADGLGNRIYFTLDAMGRRTGQIHYNPRGEVVSGRNAVFDTLLESDDGGFTGINTYSYAKQTPLRFNGLSPELLDSSGGSKGLPGAPTPFDVFVPGTPANNAFVQSVYQIGQAIKNLCPPDEKEEQCHKQYERDLDYCDLFYKANGPRWYAQCMEEAFKNYQRCRGYSSPD